LLSVSFRAPLQPTRLESLLNTFFFDGAMLVTNLLSEDLVRLGSILMTWALAKLLCTLWTIKFSGNDDHVAGKTRSYTDSCEPAFNGAIAVYQWWWATLKASQTDG
jgi:hypothetical protein